jgi:outer membrane immunogenic protein
MKKLATVIAVAGLIGTPALAADMPVKGPPPPPAAPVYNWTGWYVGGNLGASFGHVKTDFNVAPVTVPDVIGQTATGLGIAGSNTLYPSGFMGGGQIGYNWQYSPLIVVGLEADFQGSLEREHGLFAGNYSAIVPFFSAGGVPVGTTTVTGTVLANYQTKIDWFGTVRGRIGYLWGDGAVLTYVTGGLAYGEVKINGTSIETGTSGPFSFSIAQAFGHSQVNTGWVVGYGVEGKLLIPGWTYKIENLYMDLGTLNTTGVTTGASTTGFGLIGGQVTTHSHFIDGILRLGVNYQFH